MSSCEKHHSHDTQSEKTAIDPVCGMTVKIDGAANVVMHDCAEHYFCSPGCKAKFVADPGHYLSGAHLDRVEDMPEGTI